MNRNRNTFKYMIKKSFILYSLVPITILTFIFYNTLIAGFSKLSYYDNKNMNNKISQVIEEDFSDYRENIYELSLDTKIMNLLTNKDSSIKDIYEEIYDIVNDKKIKSIFYIYDMNGESILTNSIHDVQEKSKTFYNWSRFGKMSRYPDEVVMSAEKIQFESNMRSVYTIGKAILDDHGKIIGFIEFDILENELNNILRCKCDEDIVITDKYNNNIINTNNSLLDGIGKFKMNDYKRDSQLIRNGIIDGIIYVNTIKNIEFIQRFFIIGEIFLIVIFTILFAIMIYFANKISIKNTKSIDELLKGLEYVQNGDFTRKLSINTNDEFQKVEEYYNKMIDKIRELMNKNEEEIKRATLAQIKHLESQFNPHFLFNTLEMLRYMIKMNDKNAEKVTLSMAKILRYSLDNNIRSTRLKDDIRYIEDYLFIQKLRYGNKFDYKICIGEGLENVIIPKLIIQPIIENSIKYGFHSKEYLYININAEVIENMIIISVHDNGDGISKDEVKNINMLLKSDKNESSHIGLYNVQKRIQLIYGYSYGIEISSRQGKGTNIFIKIPLTQGDVYDKSFGC
ncbi:histidine kinase [uncultured Clostridium sp.]|uniref:sensor histidine kinase n=1 Tax=uncultured Clostridium sp. TaxID=59620 RepID=UPI0025CB9BA2|nr:histidine kinase [uncultured Clostridium sp.]